MSQRQPGERWDCEACGAPLVGALTRQGRVAPITVAPHADGNVLLHRHAEDPTVILAWVLGGDTLAKARENDVQLRRNHFMDCREAERFKSQPKEQHAADQR